MKIDSGQLVATLHYVLKIAEKTENSCERDLIVMFSTWFHLFRKAFFLSSWNCLALAANISIEVEVLYTERL